MIEVLGALALLALLATSVIVANSKFTEQAGRANRRIAAVRAADQLLTAWWTRAQTPSDKDGDTSRVSSPTARNTGRIPTNGQGRIPGPDGFTWRTRSVKTSRFASLNLVHVRLDILDARPPAKDSVLSSIDLVINEGNDALVEDKQSIGPNTRQ